MNLESLLAEGKLRRRNTRREEIQAMLAVAERDLQDAAVPGLSSDRLFLPYVPRGEAPSPVSRPRNHARKSPGVPTMNGKAWRNFAFSRKCCRSSVTK